MVTHWESSSRPLYVKTVWRDGQHHVVLRKEEEPRRSATATFSRGLRSAAKQAGERKAASSVALLLAGVRSLKAAEPKLRRCKTSVHPQERSRPLVDTPEPSTSCREVKEFSKSSPRSKSSKHLNLSIKSHSIEIHVGRENGETKRISPYFHHNESNYTNTLSQRVLIWLDLATQTGTYIREAKIEPKRIATACTDTEKLRQLVTRRQGGGLNNYQLYIPDDNNDCKEIFVEGTSQTVQLQNTNHEQNSVEENASYHPVVTREDTVSESGEEPLLKSELEENLLEETLELLPKNRSNTVKRQLHIFMPNLPKKNSDCDSSILSSSLSSCLLQNSVYSRKI